MKRRGFGFILFLILFGIAACGGGQGSNAPVLDGLAVFGDDLSDGGGGRWTNGPTYFEWLHGHLGIRKGSAADNFAVAGATTGTLNLMTGEGGGLLSQIQKYLAANPAASPTTLYILSAGGNNFLAENANMEKVVPEAMEDLAEAVHMLVQTGAKHIVLVGIPSYGPTPFAQAQGLREALDAMTVSFNDNLALLADDLKGRYPGVSFFLVDAFEVQFGVLLMPELFGLKDVENACSAGGETCAGPDKYLWWDEMHFSRIFHQILGGQFANVLCAEPGAYVNCQKLERD